MKGIIKAIKWIKRRFRKEKKREGYYFADGREAETVYADTIEAADAPLVYDPEIALSKEPVELTVHFDEEAMRRALEAFQEVKEALAKMAEIILNGANVLCEEIAKAAVEALKIDKKKYAVVKRIGKADEAAFNAAAVRRCVPP
ncbi:MAG: hypothetical protein IJ662_04335 [Clostridia bacterium]|nr:hypothetical protein [Clostridia bacterium]